MSMSGSQGISMATQITAKRLHSIVQGRRAAAHPGKRNTNMAVYAEGVALEFVASESRRRCTRRVKPLRGLVSNRASITQGALRDPGLWCETPSALIRQLNRAITIRRGLTLIEVVASTMIVGLMTVAALNSLGAATRSSESIGNRAVAQGLADELMSEIIPAAYSDPNGATNIGPDGAESAGPRSVFNDVDDYHGWDKSPPQYRDGTVMPDRADWRHRVEVTRIVPDDPTQTSGSDQGAKLIRVTVEYRGQILAEQLAVRTNTDGE